MDHELLRLRVHSISYAVAAIVLFVMFVKNGTPIGLFGGIFCLGAAVKYLVDYLRYRKKTPEQEDEDE